MEKIVRYLEEQLENNNAIVDKEAFLELALASLKRMIKFNYTDKKKGDKSYVDNGGIIKGDKE